MEKLYLLYWFTEEKEYYCTFERFRSVSLFINDNKLSNFSLYYDTSEVINDFINNSIPKSSINFFLS